MVDRKIGAINSQVLLQENATSTVAGAAVDVEQSGTYRFLVEGTLDATARPQLFVKSKNGTRQAYTTINNGLELSATLTNNGRAINVDLCAGDEVDSQNLAGGTTNYTTKLTRIR